MICGGSNSEPYSSVLVDLNSFSSQALMGYTELSFAISTTLSGAHTELASTAIANLIGFIWVSFNTSSTSKTFDKQWTIVFSSITGLM